MAMNFGTLDFAVAFNRQTAFPLDAKSYFESLELATAAAASAQIFGACLLSAARGNLYFSYVAFCF